MNNKIITPEDSPDIPLVVLNDGVRMPAIGFGTAGVKLEGSPDATATYDAIRYAIECGYRFFDTAALYGNEACVGRALNDAIAARQVKREDLFICTKVWNTTHKRASVERAFRDSLRRLQLDYIDLYLVHWPMGYAEDSNDPINPRDPNTDKLLYSDTHFLDTWLGMEDVREMGLARSIGLSNFNHKQIDQILNMPRLRFKPSVLQVELHPYFAQQKLHDYCRQHDITLCASCPLGAPGANWPEAAQPKVIHDEYIRELAEQHRRTPGQILLRYAVERRVIPVPKSNTRQRIRHNIEVFDFDYTLLEMQQLMALDRDIRYCLNVAGEYPTDHPHYPFNEEY